MEVIDAMYEFKQWDYAEQKRLLWDHIPVRDARKAELVAKCEGVHCFRKALGYRAQKLNLMQCIHCGMRTNDSEVLAKATNVVNKDRIDEFKAFLRWNNETARTLLANHIVERKARLAKIQEQCDHHYQQKFSYKKRRRESVCVHCKHVEPMR